MSKIVKINEGIPNSVPGPKKLRFYLIFGPQEAAFFDFGTKFGTPMSNNLSEFPMKSCVCALSIFLFFLHN
jgi:hypothetical protein